MSDGSGGERPALGATIDIPAASSVLANLHLMWAVRTRAGSGARGLVLLLATVTGFVTLGFVVDPVIGFFICVPVVWIFALDTFGSLLMWRSRGGARFWASLRPGGIDIATETFTTSYPMATIRRWEIAGPALTFVVRSGVHLFFDLRRYGPIPVAAVGDLLASEASDATPDPDAALGLWVTTVASNQANRRVGLRLVPTRRLIGAVTFVAYLLLLTLPVLVALSASLVVRNGWDVARRQIADGGLATTLAIVGVMIVVMVSVYVTGRQKQDRAVLDHHISVHADEDALVVVDRTDGVYTRIPWAAIDRFSVDDDWIGVLTRKPRGYTTIPVPALTPSGREVLVAMLESRGAAELPPVPSRPAGRSDPSVPVQPGHEMGERA